MKVERLLGAVLAGGESRRFGSDKAAAELNGTTLLALAVARLRDWCGKVVVVGREAAPVPCIPDWPRPGMGPLGGIAGALRLAAAEGFDAVLVCGVDCPGLPDDLPAALGSGPAYLADQPVIGIWPVAALAAVEAILCGEGRHSMRALAERTGAQSVDLDRSPANVNTPADLARLRSRDC